MDRSSSQHVKTFTRPGKQHLRKVQQNPIIQESNLGRTCLPDQMKIIQLVTCCNFTHWCRLPWPVSTGISLVQHERTFPNALNAIDNFSTPLWKKSVHTCSLTCASLCFPVNDSYVTPLSSHSARPSLVIVAMSHVVSDPSLMVPWPGLLSHLPNSDQPRLCSIARGHGKSQNPHDYCRLSTISPWILHYIHGVFPIFPFSIDPYIKIGCPIPSAPIWPSSVVPSHAKRQNHASRKCHSNPVTKLPMALMNWSYEAVSRCKYH